MIQISNLTKKYGETAVFSNLNYTFENAMETLEEIVNQLEAGDIPLNELIDKYNEGMKLSAFCLDELNRAKDAIYAEVDVKDNKIIEKKLDIEGDY